MKDLDSPSTRNVLVDVHGAPIVMADIVDSQIHILAHLDPETDLVARAICEKLGIDWRSLRRTMRE
jgi:hypothetical protein